MAIVDRGLSYGAVPVQEREYEAPPGLIDVTIAHLNTENTIGLALNSLSEHWEPTRQLFYGDIDPRLKELEFNINSLKGSKYEAYQRDFLDVKTEAEALTKKKRIDRELEFHDTIARGGISTNLIASLASGIIDPTSWITLGSLSMAGRAANLLARSKTGAAIVGKVIPKTMQGKQILAGAALATEQAALGESIAQGLSYERSTSESMVNIGASALLGGLIGSGLISATAKQASSATRDAWRSKVQPRFVKDMNDIASNGTGGPSTGKPKSPDDMASALGVNEPLVGQIPGWRNQSAQKALSWFGKATPGNRLVMSPSREAQKATQKLITHGYMMDDNLSGVATNQRTVHVMATRAKTMANDIYGSIMLDTQKKMREAGYKYSKDRLSKEMYATYTNGTPHAISIVNDGLKAVEKNLFDVLRQNAIDVGMFTPQIRTKYARGYLPRLWNADAIRKNRIHFTNLITTGHKNERTNYIAKANTLRIEINDIQKLVQQGTDATDLSKRLPALEKKLSKLEREILTDTEIEQMAKAQVHDMFYSINGNIEFHVSRKDRRRMLPIENQDALPYLIDDFEMSVQMMIQRMTTDTALHQKFKAHESFLQTQEYKAITKEYEEMVKTNPNLEEKLNKEYEANIRDLVGIWDIMRGKYGKTVHGTADENFRRGVNMMRGYGVITKLGSMAFSSLADIALGIHHTGVKRFMGTAVSGLIRTEGWNLARDEAKALGFVFNTELRNTLPRDLLSITEQTGMHTLPERMVRKGQNFVVKWSGAEMLESIKGRLNTMLIQQDILKNCEAIVQGTTKPNQRAFLASIGINETKAKIYYDNFKQHGKVKENFYLGGFDKWNKRLRTDFIYSLQAGFEKLSLNPQEWEKPLFLSTTAGRLMGQWMGWAFTAYDKIVIAGLQRGDANTLFGILTTIGIAAIAEQLREIWTGVREDRRMKPDQVLSNAIVKSGITGHAGVMLERVAAIVGGKPAYYLAGRTVDNTRVATPERAAVQILGPTAGTLADIVSATYLLTEDRKAQNTRALTKLMPFRNMMPFRLIWDKAENGLNDALGVEQPDY